MPCVGNDVVDLSEPANAGKSKNSRFLKKILTDAEIEFINNTERSEAALWSFWACKEAAYKVKIKSFPGIPFIPRRWQVVFNKLQSEYSDGEVIIPGKGSVYIRYFSNLQYVHCVGADSSTVLDKLIWSVEALPEEKEINPSLFLRDCLGEKLANNLSLNFHDIKIMRTKINGEFQQPRVYVGGKETDIDISLSHDGRFVAYAYHL
ncbi:MAG: 4'-phosphopantetheinyl transferase superfamily protein [Smithella sp.]